MVLTGAGEVFLPWARQVLADCEAGAAAVRDLLGLQRGRLALGATPSLTTNLLPPVLASFHRRHPGSGAVGATRPDRRIWSAGWRRARSTWPW